MPFRPEPVDPDFSKLLTVLNKSKTKQADTPMYQVVERLLDQLMKFKTNVNARAARIEEQLETADEPVVTPTVTGDFYPAALGHSSL